MLQNCRVVGEKAEMHGATMRFCILMVRSSTTSGSFRLRWRALFVSPRSSSVAAADGGGEGLVCAVPCRADTTLLNMLQRPHEAYKRNL